MVEYTPSLDSIFGSLADPTRRDILQRVAGRELTVSQIAEPYDLSLAAVSKHLKILERAKLRFHP
jgi:DNA-binding transcriptional ArsR family regulator